MPMITPRMYSLLSTRIYQPKTGLTYTYTQREVKVHPASLSDEMCSSSSLPVVIDFLD